jgi:hypothetical protein
MNEAPKVPIGCLQSVKSTRQTFSPGGTTRHAPCCSGGPAVRLLSQAPIATEVAYFLQIEPGPTVTAAAVHNREIVDTGQMDDYVGAAAAVMIGL